MHAVVVKATISDPETAADGLRNQVVPQVKQAPGFHAGYWTRSGNSGMAMVVFDSEDAANTASQMVRSQARSGVTIDDVEVREVVASA